MKQNKSASLIVITIFSLALLTITLWTVLTPAREYSETERRTLAMRPDLTLDSLTTRIQTNKFSEQYEKYVADQFIARDMFVSIKNNCEQLLGKRDMNGVYLAQDGYLISKEDRFNATNFNKNLNIVKRFTEEAANIPTIEHVAVSFAPDSGHILSEKLPRFAPHYDYSEVKLAAESQLNTNYIDLYPILDAHQDEKIYYRTDHHWTTLGAFYAYEALSTPLGYVNHEQNDYLTTVVSDNFKGTYASKINTSSICDTIITYQLPNEGKVEMKKGDETLASIYDTTALDGSDQYNYFLGGNYPLLELNTSCDNGKTLLVIKDSYSHSLIPFLTDHYETILCVDLRYYREGCLKLCESRGVTDLLLLYQATNFSNDNSIVQLLITD